MRLFLLLIICAIICLVGFKISHQFVKKSNFYSKLVLFLQDLKLNISFKKEKLHDVLIKYEADREIGQFVRSFDEYIAGNPLEISKISELDTEELSTIKDLISNVGKYDVNNELLQLDGYIERVKSKSEQTENDKKKFSPMVIKLSILFSIAVCIVLI